MDTMYDVIIMKFMMQNVMGAGIMRSALASKNAMQEGWQNIIHQIILSNASRQEITSPSLCSFKHRVAFRQQQQPKTIFRDTFESIYPMVRGSRF